MHSIGELHLEHSFAGARMWRNLLRSQGFQAGRRQCSQAAKTMSYRPFVSLC